MINENVISEISFNILSLYLRICNYFENILHKSNIGNIILDGNCIYIKCPFEYKKYFDTLYINEYGNNIIVEYSNDNDSVMMIKLTLICDKNYNYYFLKIYNEYINKVKNIYPINDKSFIIEYNNINIIEELKNNYYEIFNFIILDSSRLFCECIQEFTLL